MRYEYNNQTIRPVVEVYHDSIAYLGGVTLREFFLDKKKCATAWKVGTKKIADYFGDILPLRSVAGPPISYGHLICLGTPVTFPEDSEPNIKPIASSIDEAIAIMEEKKGLDYSKDPLFLHYKELCEYLDQEFPDQNIRFSGMGAQGPLTSAVLLRGQDFLYDVYDEPEKAKRYMELITDSVVDYHYFTRKINGGTGKKSKGAGLSDDFASLFGPNLWDEFVVPYWNQYFEKMTLPEGTRYIHCEGLAPQHLSYLEKVGCTHFQPSVSDLLTIENIKANTDVPFDWLLYAYHITQMTDEMIEQWVDDTVRQGITTIRTQFGRFTFESNKQDRILAYYKAFEKYRVE